MGPSIRDSHQRRKPFKAKLKLAEFVTDSARQKLAYVYFEDELGRCSAAKFLPKMKRGGSQPTSPSCRSYCERSDIGVSFND
jgi:hypothetical protein